METIKKANRHPSNVISYIICVIVMLACFYPFYYIIICSFSQPNMVSKGVFLWPVKLTLYTYQQILKQNNIPSAFLVSVARTVIGTLLCIFVTSFLAYLVTQKEMIGRKFIYRLIIITMYFNTGLIPWYITMRMYGLQNNFLLYILPGAVNAFYLILVKTFIEQLPSSLEEAARIDGAGFFKIYYRIILPLSKPIIATVTVFCAVAQWNSWTDNYFLVGNKSLQTLQLILYNYLNQAQVLANAMNNSTNGGMDLSKQITPLSIQMGVTVITILPIMLVYPFLQKQFAKGIMMGAIKG